jgi:hypothetical protein
MKKGGIFSITAALTAFFAAAAAAGAERAAMRVGARVYDNDFGTGRVVKVLAKTGEVRVDFDAYGVEKLRKSSELAVKVLCSSQKICEGTRVLDPDYAMGRVVEVFSNDRALVSFDQHEGIRPRETAILSSAEHLAKANRAIAEATGVSSTPAAESAATVPQPEQAL